MVKAFRRRTGRAPTRATPLTKREWWILSLVALQALFVAWGFGIRLWSHYACLGIAVVGFVTLFVPMHGRGFFGVESTKPMQNLRRLLAFPVFWLGLYLCAYVAIQGLNPHLALVTRNGLLYLEGRNFIDWLPSGISAPIELENAFRRLLMFAAPWLMACTLWVGLRRRRAVRLLCWVLALHGFAWATIALLQSFTKAEAMLWKVPPLTPRAEFWGTIVNPNHGGAYLNLLLVLVLYLTFSYISESRRLLTRGGPHLFFLLASVVFAVSVLLTHSRGAIAIMLLIVGLGVLFGLATLFRAGHWFGNPIGLAILALLLGGVGWVTFHNVDPQVFEKELRETQAALDDPTGDVRWVLNEASLEMFKDRSLYGWGAGSYAFYFRAYQQYYPILMQPVNGVAPSFRHAHNDYLQYPIELGIAGTASIVGMILWAFGYGLYHWRQLTLGKLMLFGGLAIIAVHAAFDFIFFNPVTLTTYVLLAVLGLKLLQTEAFRKAVSRAEAANDPTRGQPA